MKGVLRNVLKENSINFQGLMTQSADEKLRQQKRNL